MRVYPKPTLSIWTDPQSNREECLARILHKQQVLAHQPVILYRATSDFKMEKLALQPGVLLPVDNPARLIQQLPPLAAQFRRNPHVSDKSYRLKTRYNESREAGR